MLPPAILLNSRIIDRGQLRVDVRIGGETVPMQRDGDKWSGRFSLPGPGNHTLEITWFERIGTVDLQLAAATPVQLSENSSRNLSISSYSTDGFDFDGDGMSNFSEREAGTDPLVQNETPITIEPGSTTPGSTPTTGSTPATSPAPHAGQRDCRDLDRGIEEPIVPVSQSFEQLREIQTTADQIEYTESYWVQVPGVLRIEHTAGNPENSFASIFDADLTEELRVLDISEINLFGTGPRAVTEATLVPGIYCYVLGDPLVTTPLSSLQLRVSFTAN